MHEAEWRPSWAYSKQDTLPAASMYDDRSLAVPLRFLTSQKVTTFLQFRSWLPGKKHEMSGFLTVPAPFRGVNDDLPSHVLEVFDQGELGANSIPTYIGFTVSHAVLTVLSTLLKKIASGISRSVEACGSRFGHPAAHTSVGIEFPFCRFLFFVPRGSPYCFKAQQCSRISSIE